MSETTPDTDTLLRAAAKLIASSRYLTAFSGAGISVESGIPPFRGPGGVWEKYDPEILDLDYFRAHPEKSWPAIRDLFTVFLGTGDRPPVRPNRAHEVLADWERQGRLKTVITQNIDGLHAAAGSQSLVEFHGHCRTMTCLDCGKTVPLTAETARDPVPRCPCGGLFKPDFIFFGEGIPAAAMEDAEHAALHTDCMILVGTSGVVYPAAAIPPLAKRHGATIIEINPVPSDYTPRLTDLFLPLKAAPAFDRLAALLPS